MRTVQLGQKFEIFGTEYTLVRINATIYQLVSCSDTYTGYSPIERIYSEDFSEQDIKELTFTLYKHLTILFDNRWMCITKYFSPILISDIKLGQTFIKNGKTYTKIEHPDDRKNYKYIWAINDNYFLTSFFTDDTVD